MNKNDNFLTKLPTDLDHVTFFPGISLKCLSKKGSLLQKKGEVFVLIFEQIYNFQVLA